jgi:signal transduction histidine kinase
MRLRGRVRPSVRLRLTLIYSGLFVLAGAALLTVNYLLVSQREHRSGTAVSIVCKPGAGLGLGPAGPGLTGPRPGLTGPGPGAGGASGPSGCAQVSVRGVVGTPPLNAAVGALEGPSRPASVPNGGLAALAGLASRAQNHTLHSLEVESALALGVMAVASLGLGWLVAGRALRPVHQITATARRLSEQTLHERIGLDGPDDELKELADTFDAMLARLDRAFASHRRFVANASHELRTPLATERVLMDEALANPDAGVAELRSTLSGLRASNEQTERLIDALLVLARSERGVHRWVPTDLSSLAAQAVERARAEAAGHGVELRTQLFPAVTTGDPTLLERLIGNLVENGIRHNRTSGWLEVATDTWQGRPRVAVANSGRVLDPESVPTLFEPFRRGGADRVGTDGGFGLGLSIVRSVVEAHGGRIDAVAPPDGGLRVVVVLPPSLAAQSVGTGAPAAASPAPPDGESTNSRPGRPSAEPVAGSGRTTAAAPTV